MSFHLCPFSDYINRPRLTKLIDFSRARIPIYERARLASLQRAVTLQDAMDYLDGKIEKLNHSDINLTYPIGFEKDKLAMLLSHFASIFSSRELKIHIERESTCPYSVRLFFNDEAGATALNFDFFILRQGMELCHLNSDGEGGGGKAVAALYNFAKDYGLSKIYFSVMLDNDRARAFYFHTDFGAPRGEGRWEVEVKRETSRG